MRPYSFAFPVGGVERLGRDVGWKMGDARAELSPGAQAGGVPLEGGLEGVDAALSAGPETFVQPPAHARQQLEALIALVDLHLPA